MAVGKETFILLRNLVYPKTLSDASITEIQEALLKHDVPTQFERAKFHILIRNPQETVLEFEVRIQEHLDVALRQIGHRGFTGPSYKERFFT